MIAATFPIFGTLDIGYLEVHHTGCIEVRVEMIAATFPIFGTLDIGYLEVHHGRCLKIRVQVIAATFPIFGALNVGYLEVHHTGCVKVRVEMMATTFPIFGTTSRYRTCGPVACPFVGLALTAASLTIEPALSSLRLRTFNEFKQLTAYSFFVQSFDSDAITSILVLLDKHTNGLGIRVLAGACVL